MTRVETGRVSFKAPTGTGLRGIPIGKVTFAEPFKRPPVVHMAISNIDISHTRNLRISAGVTEVDKDNFVYQFVTWADTEVHSAVANWIAIGEDVDSASGDAGS